MQILSKTIMIVLITIMLLNMFSTTIYAAIEIELNKAYIQTIGYADNHLKYYREASGKYTYYTTILAGYKDSDGTIYPVYCMDRLLPGADEKPYYVTIDKLLDNDRVWRVIKNGYPYKTAKEWGLTDDYNVYAITRFAIYCVLGQMELNYFKADSDDKEAVAMLKALKELVNIGLNGTEKQDDDPLSTEKIGSFKENGNYYSQEYKVNSTSDFNIYEIEKVSGIPEGGYIADTKGNKQTLFKKGENFVVMIPKSQLTKDIDVDIKIKADCKAYVILEGKTTVSGTQDYVVTAGEYSTATTKAELKEKINTGKVIINKIDKDKKTPIEGVEFKLLDEKGKEVSTVKTNSKGIAEFNNLVQGIYTLVETKTNNNYILSEENNEIEVKYNKTTEIQKENEYKKRKIKNIQSR